MPANVLTMFSHKEVPWHGLGHISDRRLTLEEAMPVAGLDFEVGLRPLYIGGNNSSKHKVKGLYSITRLDTMQLLGTATKRYKIYQNHESGELVQALTGDDNCLFETAGVLDDGKRIWFLCQLNHELYIGGDQIAEFFLVTNSHDGKGSLTVCLTPIRVVCANTLAMALKGAKRVIRVRHIGDMESRMIAKAEILGLTKKYYETFEEFANKLIMKKVSEAQIETLLNEVLFPMPEDAAPRGVTLVENARLNIRNCLAKPDLANVKDTAWGVYNAVADYSDHERIIKGIEKDLRGAQERGFTRTFEDHKLKDATLSFLTSV